MYKLHYLRPALHVVLILVFILPWASASAEDIPSTSSLPSTTRAALKTIAFQAAANLSDSLIFSAILGTDITTSAIFFAANTATAMAIYLPYELTWDVLGPPPDATTAQTVAIKTVGYQAITGIRNLALSYAFSGTLLSSATFVAAVAIVDATIYAINEYAWDIFSPRDSSRYPAIAP